MTVKTWVYRIFPAVVLIALSVWGVHMYRQVQIERLYSEAATELPLLQSEEAERAVADLDKYAGADVTNRLLNIALNKDRVWNGTVRTIAIRRLSTRGGPNEAAALATLLQPHQDYGIRSEAAVAINAMPCNRLCTASILHYLERISFGELHFEDMGEILISRENPRGKLSHSREQEGVYHLLEGIIKREDASTIATLREVYGLDSGFPSPFSMEIAARLHLVQTCPWLLATKKLFDKHEVPVEEPYVGSLRRSIDAVGCK